MWVKYLAFDVALNWENMGLRVWIVILVWAHLQNHSLIVLGIQLKGECGKGSDVSEMYFIPNELESQKWAISILQLFEFSLLLYFSWMGTLNSVSTVSVHPT